MKRITIDSYPTTFSFKTRTKLPKAKLDKPYKGQQGIKRCPVRQKLLLSALYRLNVNSPCHGYSDYVIEFIDYAPNGDEFWTLGS